MISESTPIKATTADVQLLAEKLARFSADLKSGERAALRDLLERATAEDEVQGFGFAGQAYDAALTAAFNPVGAFRDALAERRRGYFSSDIINDPSRQGY